MAPPGGAGVIRVIAALGQGGAADEGATNATASAAQTPNKTRNYALQLLNR